MLQVCHVVSYMLLSYYPGYDMLKCVVVGMERAILWRLCNWGKAWRITAFYTRREHTLCIFHAPHWKQTLGSSGQNSADEDNTTNTFAGEVEENRDGEEEEVDGTVLSSSKSNEYYMTPIPRTPTDVALFIELVGSRFLRQMVRIMMVVSKL